MTETSDTKRIFLLTGATGNIGGNVCCALISKGEPVRALIRNPKKVRFGKEVELSCGDVLDVPSLEAFFQTEEGTDVYVIHCAGIVTLEPEFSQKVHDVNITGTQNVIDLCVKHRVKKLVYVSSSSAIPELPGDVPAVFAFLA